MKAVNEKQMWKLLLTLLVHRLNFRYSHDQGLLSAHQEQERRSSNRMSRPAPVE